MEVLETSPAARVEMQDELAFLKKIPIFRLTLQP